MGKGKVGFGDGASALINGFRHLSHPTLRAWVIWPILINLAVFAGLAWLLTGWLTGSIQDVMDGLPEWLNFLRWIMWVLAVLMMALGWGELYHIDVADRCALLCRAHPPGDDASQC